MAKIRVRRPTLPRAAWEDDPASGNARPTPEQLARGSYDLIPGERVGSRVAINRASCPLDRAYNAGKITEGEKGAGERWLSLRRAEGARNGLRSCLNDTPRGRDGDFHARHQIDAARMLMDAYRVVSPVPGAWNVLVDVVEMEMPVGHMDEAKSRAFRLLKWALGALADLWGLE